MKDSSHLLDLPVERAARLLALRFLADAAEGRRRLDDPADEEALHDFRVGLRRLRSTLRTYRPWLRESVRGRDRRRVASLAHATGESRDLEVQLGWLQTRHTRQWARERASAEWLAGRLRERKRHADGDLAAAAAGRFEKEARRLSRRLARYDGRIDPALPAGGPRLRDVMWEVADALVAEMRARLAEVQSIADQEPAHGARIAGKRLRYLLEPFAGGIVDGKVSIGRLKELQELLGEMHDAHVLLEGVRAAEGSLAEREVDGEVEAEPHPDPSRGLVSLRLRLERRQAKCFRALKAGWLGGRGDDLLAAIADSVRALSAGRTGDDTEIERKYLLRRFPRLPDGAKVKEIDQGYLPGDRLNERIRRVKADGEERWYRTVKVGTGISRLELEEEAPAPLGKRLWELTDGKRVRKRRYVVAEDDGLKWEIDRFRDRRLVLAEVELPAEDAEVAIPAWLEPYVVREVTGDPDYLNLNLAR